MDRRTFLTFALAAPALAQPPKPAPKPAAGSAVKPAAPAVKPAAPAVPWTQWGGPNRNFHTEARA